MMSGVTGSPGAQPFRSTRARCDSKVVYPSDSAMMNTSGSTSAMPIGIGSCPKGCTSTGSAGPDPVYGGTHHSSFELSTVTSTEPSARTARFSMKYFSGKYATGVSVTSGTGDIGMT
jgi:hypothetical protein